MPSIMNKVNKSDATNIKERIEKNKKKRKQSTNKIRAKKNPYMIDVGNFS